MVIKQVKMLIQVGQYVTIRNDEMLIYCKILIFLPMWKCGNLTFFEDTEQAGAAAGHGGIDGAAVV